MATPAEPGRRAAAEAGSTEFEVFDLTVNVGPGLVPWISAASRLGHVHGIPRRDSEVPPLDELLDSVYDFVDAVRFAERDPSPGLTRTLGQLVFGEPSVLELFQATRGAAADRGREMLVRLLASPHLAVLPWELLPDPAQRHSERDGRFLALAPDASVVRLARGRTYPVRSDRLEPPLNLLVVVSSPIARDPKDDSLAFDIYEEKRSLLAELEPLEDAGLLRVDVEDQPTLENLRRRIGSQRRGYHLFHYLGHAEPDRLILEDEQGRRDDQSGSRFTDILRLCPDLRLAVFAGCETARPAGDPMAIDVAAAQGRHLMSLSDRCVQESCPMVVGMQAVLPFRTERLFTRFFYQGLVSGYSVAGALRLARGATRGDRHVGGDLLDWSVPVLFVGGAEPGPLVDRTAKGVEPERPMRHVLRLGLKQRETRFFARDVALRQAIDVLAGEAPERVLVLTGAAGVGKTMLIDRALEELSGEIVILYVGIEELAPEIVTQLERMTNLKQPWSPTQGALAELEPQAPLQRLCVLVAELLTRCDGRRRAAEPGLTPRQWWPRLIEELTSRRFVLVIDNVELLVDIEAALTDVMLWFWFARRFEEFQARGAAEGSLAELLEALIDRLRQSGGGLGGTQLPGAPGNLFVAGLPEIAEWLGGYGRSRGKAGSRIAVAAQRLLRDVRQGGSVKLIAADVRDRVERAGGAKSLEALRAGLERLAQTRQVLDVALRTVADRRSGLRLCVSASELPDGFLAVPSDQRFVMRLGRLTWSETWRWIRRNLPGLLRYGEEYLGRLWPRLGPELERWEELERRILASSPNEPKIEDFVNDIAPRRGSTRLPGGTRYGDWRPRGERPLRVAVAGPHVASAEALARAVTRLAAEHGVGGHVVTGESTDSGSLAVLIDVPSPFRDGAAATESGIVDWITQVADRQPDIILLDYGYSVSLPPPGPDSRERPVLQRLSHQALMIAAGGNQGPKGVTAPGIYDEVLAVGPLDGERRLQPYAEWTPKSRKPDIFMKDQLLGTPLQEALVNQAFVPATDEARQGPAGLEPGTHGSSFAALHAVATAILVWSTVPDLTPTEIRDVLRMAARPIDGVSQPAPMALEVADAVAAARRESVRRTLLAGPCSLQALAAITGLDLQVVSNTVEQLSSGPNPEVRCLTRGRLERYDLIVG